MNFMLYLNIHKILKISFWTFWKKNYIYLVLYACKTARWKQPRLVKPWLIFFLNFIFKTPGVAFLEKISSYWPSPSLSQENRKSFPPTPLDTSVTALVSIFSSILNSIIEGWNYRSRKLSKAIFCHQKNKKKANRLCMKFSPTSNTSACRFCAPIPTFLEP